MNWLEWVGIASITIFGSLGAGIVFLNVLGWAIQRNEHFVKALYWFYADKLRRENSELDG